MNIRPISTIVEAIELVERAEGYETREQKFDRLNYLHDRGDLRNYHRLSDYYKKTGQDEIPWHLIPQAD